jgi:hypothetical protein
MRYFRSLLLGVTLLLLTACSSIDDGPLELSLELTKHAANSVEDIQGQIILSNQGKSDLLVQRRLHTLPMPAPPGLMKCAS